MLNNVMGHLLSDSPKLGVNDNEASVPSSTDGISHPIAAMFEGIERLRSLSGFIGPDATTRVLVNVLDDFVVKSEHTSRSEPLFRSSQTLSKMLPKGYANMLNELYHWADYAIAYRLVSEETIEGAISNPDVIRNFVTKLMDGAKA